ncbi:CaiB/BaiF CoA transferase family protein [Actinoalloteichus hymeniacidonis]|uniref:Acyl-CoA transferase/carnitine dehydratase n=1 Tax=Actinoalloteichus hymeniacidonis TaxID=340345 RepID=A0AAC9HVT4_9PSEU|nr:CoA transferase [Actinoalloteichus hymeniacidonis]AOS65931.1 putative acyl-CoA transferase/carnitine dehydratase [Actinoalloteichus hymeniacidonis]MBB5905973.1 crotonobetainyl-CoA:carnitine CoA-transferase CaiB-like acyl-CoA transferase [Actinoalloteichus hymeniacidonis]
MTTSESAEPTGGLLAGVRVLDLSNVLAGPYAGYQLGLFGADVIKVEVPGSGDLARQLGADAALNEELLGASFLAQNAGKRSITVNLKTERGREVFAKLVAAADVLVESFRPGVLERLGFSWARLRELNPRLVYCAISGFGQTGPLRARPAYDQIIQGLSGMMSVTGSLETAPIRAGYPVGDTLGGLAAAMAVSAALVRASRTGVGAQLDVSMLESAITALGWAASNHLIAGREPVPMGNENATAAPSGTFQTADGDLNIAANKQEQFLAVCEVVGRPDLAVDPRFVRREDRKTNRIALRDELESALRTKPAVHWEDRLSEAGVPAARVLDVADALSLDQITEREFVHELPFPGDTKRSVRVLGNGVRVDGAASTPAASPPLLGEHTRVLLTELGYDEAQIRELIEEGAV